MRYPPGHTPYRQPGRTDQVWRASVRPSLHHESVTGRLSGLQRTDRPGVPEECGPSGVQPSEFGKCPCGIGAVLGRLAAFMPGPAGGPIPSKQVNYLILNDFSCRPDLLRLSVAHRTTPASLSQASTIRAPLPASQPDRQLFASPRLASRRQHRQRALSDSPSFRLYPAENRQPRLPRACGAVSRSRPLDARPPNKGCPLPTGAPARAVSPDNEKGGGRPTAPPPCSCHPARPTGAVAAPFREGRATPISRLTPIAARARGSRACRHGSRQRRHPLPPSAPRGARPCCSRCPACAGCRRSSTCGP